MRIGYRADQRFWLHVPSSFPSGDFPSMVEWEADVTERFRQSRPDAGAGEVELAREQARAAVRNLPPTASFGLQFWPAPAPLGVLLSVEVAPPLRAGDDPVVELLGDVELAFPPSIEAVETPELGSGILARFIARSAADGREQPAGIGYVLSGRDCAVRITSEATSTTMVGLIDAPLREVVETMRVVA